MAKAKHNFFDKLIVPIAFAFAVALFLGIIAGTVDPQKNILVAFFGLAYPYTLFINIIFIAYWLLRKKYIYAGIIVCLVLYGSKTLHATFSFIGEQGAATKNEQAIRVMTYNVHSFKLYGSNNTQSVKEKMLQVIKDENPDVICMQEFFTRFRGPYNTIDSLKRLLNTKHYYFMPVSKNDYEAFGLAIFSKYPIKSTGNVPFQNGVAANMSIYADLDIKGKNLRVYNTHLQSISFEKEDYDYLDSVKDMHTKMQPTKRILKRLKTAFLSRSIQVDIMKKELENCKSPFVIAGDFNDTPASFAVTKITSGLQNTFTEKGSGLGKTYNGKFPNFQIDYIATTKDFEVENYKIIQSKLSDHFPVRSDIKFKL
jgi:endonuclease/exonuclease/phosphatase family metal-dependent hydrolase